MEIIIGTIPSRNTFASFPPAEDYRPSAPLQTDLDSIAYSSQDVVDGGRVFPSPMSAYPDLRK